MRLRHGIPWHKEVTVWVWGLFIVLLMGGPLVVWSVAQVQPAPSAEEGLARTSQEEVQAPQEEPASAAALPENVSLDEVDLSQMTLGRGVLDLNALTQGHGIGESDNARWSLVRRTPEAAQVFHPESGVDWAGLRNVSAAGTILVPAGFPWSFNETFQEGPGYKKASGILAGGHCALASAFRAAAVETGLPVEYRRHATPIPGFTGDESVNILWGRDDLVVHNNSAQDLYFVWSVGSGEITIAVVPVTQALPLPPLPDWRQGTVAMVYGRPGPGGWGSLGESTIVDYALHLARTFAGRVDEWNGNKPVAVAVNPNVVMAGKTAKRELYLYHLIAEARRQGYYVMLDVQPGDEEPLSLFETLMDQYLRENVWFDWDIEHTAGGQVDAAQVNRVAAAYFDRRQAQGYQAPGIFGFYVFKESQITDPADVQRQYAGGAVVPIFDGYGGRSSNPGADKIAKTDLVLSRFGQGAFGMMEFETRWGTRYDKISARAYFEAYPDTLIFASQ
jgi:hypothetical protein